MLAIFNGSHTIKNRETGDYRTFRIHTVQRGPLKEKRILSLLTGPDNNHDYKSFAFVNDDGRIHVWQKYRGQGNWNAYAHMIRMIVVEEDPQWVEKYDHLLEGRCARCNRKLTVPESIESGYGPECIKRT
jgi:hypothetical protein